MKILIAPNSMKGSLDAFRFTDLVEQAFLRCSSSFEICKVPVADGGDLTGRVLSEVLHAKKVELRVFDPLGREIQSEYSVSGKTAIIEMADASGIKQMKPGELNPMKTSSFGTGQLIQHAIENGCNEVLLGVGGSATVDGGAGMLEALGFQFFDSKGNKVAGNGAGLLRIAWINKPSELQNIQVKAISDVDNPLLGKNGAAEVFAPQKGATPEMVTKLEKGLRNWVSLLEIEAGKNLSDLKGAGAAGGIALPLVTFFNAEIVPGADFILKKLNFDDHVKWADLVITGEGKIDAQTLDNKAPVAVSRIARNHKKPVIAIGGSVEKEASDGFDAMFSFINRPITLEQSMEESEKLVAEFSYQMARLILALH